MAISQMISHITVRSFFSLSFVNIMCFSAQASLIAGVSLCAIWVYPLIIVKSRNYLPLALTPLLFWLQQIVEWFVWLGLSHGSVIGWVQLWTYGFLFFSQIFRVTRAPYMFWHSETWKHKQRLNILVIIGIILSSYLAYYLVQYGWQASILERHIQYSLSLPPQAVLVVYIIYGLTTIGAPLMSSRVHIQLRGITLFILACATYLLYEQYFTSIWCFCAAILSIYICYIIKVDGTNQKILINHGEDITSLISKL